MPRTARQFHLDRTYHWRPLGSRATEIKEVGNGWYLTNKKEMDLTN